ncbi:MAG: hypothetical protein ACYC0C_10690 [Devosia sp.]
MSILARSETLDQRNRIFSTLAARNRFVEVLRFAVPAAGVVIFGGLVLQLFFASLGDDFGFSSISIDRNNLVVDTPSYSSMGADGSSYQVEAASAKSALDRTDIIDLNMVVLTIKKTKGATITARADAARLETTSQLVTVDGVTRIADSKGMKGTIVGIFANMAAETMVGKGGVDITFSNGATLKAASMSYDGASSTWQFARATLTLPSTPGEDEAKRAGAVVSQSAGQAAEDITGEVTGRPALVAPRPMARRPLAQEKP